MINNGNIIRQNQFATPNLTTNISFISSRDEAMMTNVPKGFTLYAFDMFNPVFYVKQVDSQTEQVSFKGYRYEEIQEENKPVAGSIDAVTKEDFDAFKNDMINMINSVLNNNKSTSGNKSSRKGANNDE